MNTSTSGLGPAFFPSQPARTFAEAQTRIVALQALDDASVRPGSGTTLRSHGKKVERAVVFYHGYTNAPPQFARLGEEFFQRGYNVLVPRLPHHGLHDPMTTAQEKLTAEELVQTIQESVDIAQGLGEHVSVCGISCGGVMASWVAQYRSDVDLVVGIAPSAGLPFAPMWVSTLFRNVAPHLKNMYIWWDPRVKEQIVGPPYAYPRFSTHSLAQIFRLGRHIYDMSANMPARAKCLKSITSEFDTAVKNTIVYDILDHWESHGVTIERYIFPASQKVWHDMIDPNQTFQQVDLTYPVIIRMLTEA
ncbi:MAG TPA: alpha/beta hydrolase [Chloroflexi bacterium]|nr:alpha/beta hydrolase [Chloroflexota bacterium]HHW86309.1 alpha/beta hydrolase [Chloroflexota bacterium]